MRLFFFLNNWKSGNTTRVEADYSSSKVKSLFSKLRSRNDTNWAIPLDNMDEERHTEAPGRDSHESRSRILHKGVMVTREYSVTTPAAGTHIRSCRDAW
jgi:hypothetical protein